ncbi:NAD(P)/FAD-dependent oxidoreductase [Virgibacillus sp. NKC19-16]|uniref:phytoene desaturase family protein n=1 Tax=Virgibacillus salidurans TaxID=2831673 RepID=UPI001F450DED|nr:NAD(P)/FAD-dependent oxidoreductase [Virgibacillus sp. NKC19-16]UJL46160.1 NAD(P)/FAD-dependent oxidoreductase [Virgibacillus sp. NKC19-16]
MHLKPSAVVIGGGLGGLSAAISLAQAGHEVSLYEKNDHVGGKVNRLEQDGFGFDLGPSILTMPHIFERLFCNSGRKMEDYIPIQRLSHEWRSFFTDGSTVDLYSDLEKMFQVNEQISKKDIIEYRNLLNYAQQLYDITEAGYFEQGIDSTKEIVKYHGVLNSLKGFDLFLTMYGAIEKRISNPKLRIMLSYFIKYVGSSPYDAPAILNMLIYIQHKQGLWYVPGGMHQIAEGMAKLAMELGVNIYCNQEVKKLIKNEKKQIVAAELVDGTRVRGDYFISNMEVIPAYRKLLKEDEAFISKLEDKYEPSSSGLVLHLGVNKTYSQLAHHNFFFSDNLYEQMDKIFHQHQLPDDPTIYLVNVNKTDPKQAPHGHENIKILPHIPYIQDQPFTNQDYAQFRERVLVKLEKMGLDGLREHIVTEDMWTPHDIERVYGSYRGSIYGTLAHKTQNRGFKHPKHSERYENLYFVGGTVNPGGGMPMVTLSGQQVRDKINKREKHHRDNK